MDISYLQQSNCIISPPIRSSTHRPRFVLFRTSAIPRNPRNGGPFRRRNVCLASSSDTLVAGKSPEIVGKKEDEIADLKSWMHQNGLPPCKVHLKDRPSHDAKLRPIHYVSASEDLQAGDIAFSVPNSLVVTLERVLGNETVAELLTTNKLSELACLALYLMYEKKQGNKSLWYPYIRELDRQRGRGQLAVESPLLWSEAELSYLTGSPTKAEVLERAEGIRREYNELDTVWFMAGSLFQQYPYDIPTEAFPFEIFKQAFVAIQSCVVHLQEMGLPYEDWREMIRVYCMRTEEKEMNHKLCTPYMYCRFAGDGIRIIYLYDFTEPNRSLCKLGTRKSYAGDGIIYFSVWDLEVGICKGVYFLVYVTIFWYIQS